MVEKIAPLVIAALLLGACGTAPDPGPVGPGKGGQARRAALARVVVENRTAHTLTVGYRLAAEAAGTVTVGTVPPRETREVAPVPAGEPIVLFARTATGAGLTLPPRTLEVDQLWSWIIPADADFTGEDGEEA